MLDAMIQQHRHRIALCAALSAQFQSRAGRAVSEEELLAALEVHGLKARLISNETELLMGLYAEQKGATGRVAWSLGVTPPELSRLTKSLGLVQQVEEVKERYRREALASKPLPARLDLLGREKYLMDLGIKRRYFELASAELRSLLRESLPRASTLEGLAGHTAKQHGTTPAVLRRAMDQLGLTPEFEKLMS
jgi:hypothetical protein